MDAPIPSFGRNRRTVRRKAKRKSDEKEKGRGERKLDTPLESRILFVMVNAAV